MSKKTVIKGIRFTEEELKELKEEAESQGRTFSQHIRFLIAQARKRSKK